MSPEPFAGDLLPRLQIAVGTPEPKTAMIALRSGIVRPPFETREHLRPMAFLDNGAALNAGDKRVLGVRRVEPGPHVLPFENLHLATVRTRDVRMFLRTVEKALRA